MCVTKWRFSGKKIKPGVSQNTGYFIWLICFDPSNFKATSCSKAVTRQGNELLAYDCHQMTLFPRRISFYPKNFKMLLFVARVTEDVGDLYLFSSLALAFCCREITTESSELRIELLLLKDSLLDRLCHNRICLTILDFWRGGLFLMEDILDLGG